MMIASACPMAEVTKPTTLSMASPTVPRLEVAPS